MQAHWRWRTLLAKTILSLLALPIIVSMIVNITRSALGMEVAVADLSSYLKRHRLPATVYAVLSLAGSYVLLKRTFPNQIEEPQEKTGLPAGHNWGFDVACASVLETQLEESYVNWVMHNIFGGFIVIDRNENIIILNCPAFDELGCEPDSLLGQHISAFYRFPNAPAHDSPLLEALHNGSASRRVSYRLGRYFEAFNSPLTGPRGEVLGAVCLFVDVTHRVEQERELKSLEKAQRVGQLAASLTHEIRNPLALVKGYLQLLQADEQQEPFREQFALMIEQLERVNNMLQDFLGKAKEGSEPKVPASLTALVRRLQPMLESEAQLAGVSLQLELEAVPSFSLNANEIQQLLLNLYRNALEATPAGGQVTIATGTTPANQPYLRVVDSGCGMSAELLQAVYAPFVTTKPQGTGLGLPHCLNIARSYGAELAIDSTPNQGTLVQVTFPACEA
ncbi:MAG: PAS domain-containing protein [Firmicutes bacterium]|nr:PAS domain-containing protein [Bacillota bacterium]